MTPSHGLTPEPEKGQPQAPGPQPGTPLDLSHQHSEQPITLDQEATPFGRLVAMLDYLVDMVDDRSMQELMFGFTNADIKKDLNAIGQAPEDALDPALKGRLVNYLESLEHMVDDQALRDLEFGFTNADIRQVLNQVAPHSTAQAPAFDLDQEFPQPTAGDFKLLFGGPASTPDYVLRAGDQVICTFPETTARNAVEVGANARLLSAAKPMQAALKVVAEDPIISKLLAAVDNKAYNQIRKALAEAVGKGHLHRDIPQAPGLPTRNLEQALAHYARKTERQQKEIDQWTAFGEAISNAHGFTYSGSGPEDPGPDENAFDLFSVHQLRQERDLAVEQNKELAQELAACKEAMRYALTVLMDKVIEPVDRKAAYDRLAPLAHKPEPRLASVSPSMEHIKGLELEFLNWLRNTMFFKDYFTRQFRELGDQGLAGVIVSGETYRKGDVVGVLGAYGTDPVFHSWLKDRIKEFDQLQAGGPGAQS